MGNRMEEFIREQGAGARLPLYVSPFASKASGSSKDDDEDDDEDEDEDDDDDEDDDADKSDDELRDELKKTRAALSKANGQSAKRRKALRQRERELEEARKPKPKSKAKDDEDGDAPDLDVIRHEARSEGEKAGTLRAKRSEAKAALIAAGVSAERVQRAVGMLDLDDLDLDDDGLDGIDEAIDALKKDVPEMFARKRRRRESTAGERDSDGSSRRKKPQTASELAAAKILGR